MKLTVLATALAASGCSGRAQSPASPASTGSPARIRSIAGTEVVIRGTTEVKAPTPAQVPVQVMDNFFKPNVLRAPPGTRVALQLSNRGGSLHNFSLPEQALDQELPSGASVQVSVVFPASGQVLFFCKYHREESGMAGVLEAR